MSAAGHDEDHALVADSIERFLDRRLAGRGAGHAAPPAGLWEEMGAMDWLWPADDMLVVPRATMVSLVAQALGRHAVAEPFAACAVQSGALLAASDAPAAFPALERLRSGLARVVPGLLGASAANGPVAPRLTRSGAAWSLDGDWPAIDHAAQADMLLLEAAGEDGPVLLAVPVDSAGLTIAAPAPTGARADRDPWADVRARRVVVSDSQVILQGPALAQARERAQRLAAFAICATLVGTMHDVMARTLEYTKTRRQFGRPIAAFQAVQHRAVDMYIALQEADALLDATAPSVEAPAGPASDLAIAALVNKCRRAGRTVGQGGVQLHGAIALTDELRIGHALIRIESGLARLAALARPGIALPQGLLDMVRKAAP